MSTSIGYYYKVIKNMNLQDKIKNSKIKKHEYLFENIKDEQIQFEEIYFADEWIELIENYNLYLALKKLKDDEKNLLELVYSKRFTLTEIAIQFCTTHQNVAKKVKNITKKLSAMCTKK